MKPLACFFGKHKWRYDWPFPYTFTWVTGTTQSPPITHYHQESQCADCGKKRIERVNVLDATGVSANENG